MINLTQETQEAQDYDYRKWCYYLPEEGGQNWQEQGQN